jgi:hypothetical protein
MKYMCASFRYCSIFAALVVLCSMPAQAQRRLTPLEKIATSEDLPKGILGPGGYAEVRAEFDILEDGSVKNCRTIAAFDNRLRNVTCKVISERAKYKPAFDKNGKPKRARDMLSVFWGRSPAQTMVGLTDYGGAMLITHDKSWMHPLFRPLPKRKGSTVVRFGIEANGRVGLCAVLFVDGDEKVTRRLCEALQGYALFKPPVDEKGDPYNVVGSMRYEWVGTDDVPASF